MNGVSNVQIQRYLYCKVISALNNQTTAKKISEELTKLDLPTTPKEAGQFLRHNLKSRYVTRVKNPYRDGGEWKITPDGIALVQRLQEKVEV